MFLALPDKPRSWSLEEFAKAIHRTKLGEMVDKLSNCRHYDCLRGERFDILADGTFSLKDALNYDVSFYHNIVENEISRAKQAGETRRGRPGESREK